MPGRPNFGVLAFFPLRLALFVFFLASGFCSLVLQVVWLRLGMAAFGVNTAIVSIILSVFMSGLAIGSWGIGFWLRRSCRRPGTALRAYAGAELGIGLSAWIVPWGLEAGGNWLGTLHANWASASHFAFAGIWLALVLLPFCIAMGATFPLAMRAAEANKDDTHASRSFSFLYAGNVAGAAIGTLVSAFLLIELLGFRGTLKFAAGLNFLVAASALALSWRRAGSIPVAAESDRQKTRESSRPVLCALFTTGLVSMAAEVVWVRQFTPFLSTMVYAFAALLAVYLVATFCGSLFYRTLDVRLLPEWERWTWISLPVVAMLPLVAADPRTGMIYVFAALLTVYLVATFCGRFFCRGRETRLLPPWMRWTWIALPLLAVLPLAAVDPRLMVGAGGADSSLFSRDAVARLLFGILPFSAATGFVTPLLVDRYSGGRPRAAGFAYAVNVFGCILGPLLAGFVLLPLFGERWALVLLAMPLVAAGAALHRQRLAALVTAGLVLLAGAATRSFDTTLPGATVRHDSTATVSAGGSGMQKRLLVNGVGMTHLTPITKMMAHLPLAFRASPPTHGTLVICLGMGTTLRSALSWQAPATAVELIPSVVELAPYFHADAGELFSSPMARIVVDDGRRFLARSTDTFDAIVIDPPPPVYAAGSSLLYSVEFYAAARQRLAADGILQQWIPKGDTRLRSAVVAAITENFRHVRLFGSIEGWGLHILASQQAIERLTAEELAARLPPAAVSDLLEWGPAATAAEQFRAVLGREVALESLVGPETPALRDDRPVNEYFFLHERSKRAAGALD